MLGVPGESQVDRPRSQMMKGQVMLSCHSSHEHIPLILFCWSGFSKIFGINA
jgi:hypothetical protein